jgi:hypothetical protein
MAQGLAQRRAAFRPGTLCASGYRAGAQRLIEVSAHGIVLQ